jgi:hypothetical protein
MRRAIFSARVAGGRQFRGADLDFSSFSLLPSFLFFLFLLPGPVH